MTWSLCLTSSNNVPLTRHEPTTRENGPRSTQEDRPKWIGYKLRSDASVVRAQRLTRKKSNRPRRNSSRSNYRNLVSRALDNSYSEIYCQQRDCRVDIFWYVAFIFEQVGVCSHPLQCRNERTLRKPSIGPIPSLEGVRTSKNSTRPNRQATRTRI